jgi:hypothetical protein
MIDVAYGQTDRQHWVDPMLPTGHVTGYGSTASMLIMTLPAVLMSCLVIYIFWTPYKAPFAGDTNTKQAVTPVYKHLKAISSMPR